LKDIYAVAGESTDVSGSSRLPAAAFAEYIAADTAASTAGAPPKRSSFTHRGFDILVLTRPKVSPTLILHTESESGTGVSSRSLLCPFQSCNSRINDREKKEVGLP
jgi:hypothetical protein